MELYSEIYGAYYNAVAEIISRAVKGELTVENVRDIASQKTFAESSVFMPSAVVGDRWRLITRELTTPIKHAPRMPLSLLQKRWLKAVSLDPRVKLFDVDFSWLGGVEPLFRPSDIYVFDKYGDGDPYEDDEYIAHFRTAYAAIKSGRRLKVDILNRHGRLVRAVLIPVGIEYSEKDDKFRLLTANAHIKTVNMARIVSCELTDGIAYEGETAATDDDYIVFELTDERNALERAMLHFAHYEKSMERIGDNKYRVKLAYSKNDETELLIRVLSFGALIKVVEPRSFVCQICERLKKQKNLL